jgi:hypothetical protein
VRIDLMYGQIPMIDRQFPAAIANGAAKDMVNAKNRVRLQTTPTVRGIF